MSHHHRSVEGRRTYERLADRIKALIDAEGLKEGERLPAERDLALQLGVSRSSLREALIALEIYGRIERSNGSGVYVCSASRRGDVAALCLGESAADLTQARVVLESAVAMRAAARASAAGLQRVEEALEDMRRSLGNWCKPVEADRRFHLSIAELGGSAVLVGVVGTLFDGQHDPISSRMRGRGETAHSWQAALAEHEAIIRALKARDPQAAAAAMCHHLQTSHGRWLDEPTEQSLDAALPV
jgi:GntR family transcriptional regulator, transcriptional repressor for pyruvate dehydrogenase complex